MNLSQICTSILVEKSPTSFIFPSFFPGAKYVNSIILKKFCELRIRRTMEENHFNLP
jgi:hypothetical protein